MKINLLGFPREVEHVISLLRGALESVEVTGQATDRSGELMMASVEATVLLPWPSIPRPAKSLTRGELLRALAEAPPEGPGQRRPRLVRDIGGVGGPAERPS